MLTDSFPTVPQFHSNIKQPILLFNRAF